MTKIWYNQTRKGSKRRRRVMRKEKGGKKGAEGRKRKGRNQVALLFTKSIVGE